MPGEDDNTSAMDDFETLLAMQMLLRGAPAPMSSQGGAVDEVTNDAEENTSTASSGEREASNPTSDSSKNQEENGLKMFTQTLFQSLQSRGDIRSATSTQCQ